MYNPEFRDAQGVVVGENNTVYISYQSPDFIQRSALIVESPYKGLDKFEPEDKDKFFGRDQLIASLSKDLEEKNLLLLLGASGSGKSSLVRAGLIPKFLDKKFVNLTFVPDEDPFESLYACLRDKYRAKAKIAQKGEADTLIKVVRELKKDSQWLIFIDQFEELFTISQEAKRDKFIDSLGQLIELQDNSIKIVLTMRADFLDKISPYPSLVNIFNNHSRLLADMSLSDLRLAIAKPAARNGVVFQEGLVEQIINDFHGQVCSLPLLQYTLNLLWERDDITDRILNKRTYDNLGVVTGAPQQQADKVYDELLSEEQEAARQIFIDLVDVVGGRLFSRRADKANFDGGVLERTLDKLISNGLLVVSKQEKQKPTVAVAHEALLTSWEKLQGWITEAKQTVVLKNCLIDDSRHWSDLRIKEPQKAARELWSGSKLERVIELRSQPIFRKLDEDTNQFIDASVAWRDRFLREEKEQNQKLKLAIQKLDLALTESRLREQAARVLNLLPIQPLDGLVLAMQSMGMNLEKLPQQILSPVQTSLHRAMETGRVLIPFQGHEDCVSSVAFSPDGQMIVSGSGDNTMQLWRGGGWRIWLQVCCDRLRYHPVFKNPQTDVEKHACETCQKYVWNPTVGANELYQKGREKITVKDFQAAVNILNLVIQFNSQHTDAYFSRGFAYTNLKNYQRAIADFNQVIAASSNNAYAYFLRGICYVKLDNKQAAIEDFQLAADLYQQQGQAEKYQNVLKYLNQLQQ